MRVKKSIYKALLLDLQACLVTLQRGLIESEQQLLIVFEGRDAAGKDGVIKRITEYQSPRETRVVALGKPADRERDSWYFQRYVEHFPSARETVLFNRSWYNRVGVERVMGFCTPDDTERFFHQVVPFETMLVESGIHVLKYYLDISREEQAKRLEERKRNPLKQWKISPVDAVALDKFDDYSIARDEMLDRTHHSAAPWRFVKADDKPEARINIIRDILRSVPHTQPAHAFDAVDPDIIFTASEQNLNNNRLAR
jgi:polyphosphate kinase 2